MNKLNENSEKYCFDQNDILGVRFINSYNNFSESIISLLNLCWAESQKPVPTKNWLKSAKDHFLQIKNKEELKKFILDTFDFLLDAGKAIVKKLNSKLIIYDGVDVSKTVDYYHHFVLNKGLYYIDNQNQIGISYLIWYIAQINDSSFYSKIVELANVSYQKIKWYGNLSDKNGNACLFAFTQMPNEIGIINLLNLKKKFTNKNIIKLIENHIKKKALQLNLTQEALMELSTPDFNITNDTIIETIGDYVGIISTIDIENPILTWKKTSTKITQKGVPKELKEHFPEELKTFQSLVKSITTTYSVHKTRIENSYINNVKWLFTDWAKYYLHHPLLSKFNSNLIWFFDEKISAIKSGNNWIDENLELVDINQFTAVTLWHPIYSNINGILKWRNYFFNNEIRQPFKQAFREIYKLTDAEIRTDLYSNRFAAHILYQHQFSALCKIRNWNYTLQGNWDSYNVPFKKIPAFDMKIEFCVNPIEDSYNSSSIFNYVTSDQVRFYKNNIALNLELVPEIIFTESMRDIDLFVGVCSIGNNPEWQDSGVNGTYWNQYSFGELSTNAETRKQVLQLIIPKLKIADKCSFLDKYLVVKGKIRTYKIHIGSGNILMSPNDQYLCIVPDNKNLSNKIFLPFDDDRTLSIIISKAILLSEDNKITDITITKQIDI